MDNFKIRKILSEDYQYLKELWKMHFGTHLAEKRTRCFNMLIEKNPLSDSKDGYYVMVENDRIIAYDGVMPYKIFIFDTDYDGYIYHDTMVDPEQRGRGLGTKLIKGIINLNPQFSLAVWMNAPNARVFEKCGWKSVDGLYSYVRGYKADSYINTKNKILNSILVSIINSTISSIYKIEKVLNSFFENRFEIVETEHFEDDVGELFHSVKHQYGCITYRTKDVLNWKYSNKYSQGYKIFLCKQNEELLGYIVFRTRTIEGGKKLATVFDYLCSPERKDVFKALLEKSILEIEKEKPDSIEIMCSNKLLNPILKRYCFIRTNSNQYALKYINDKNISKNDILNDADKWHFTHGDGDRLFWEI